MDQPPAYYFFCPSLPCPLAAIVKPPPKVEVHSYQDLPCSSQDLAILHEIITMVGDLDKLTLLVKESYIRSLEAQIIHLHPFKFLSGIFLSSSMREKMPSIFSDYFKRTSFLAGLSTSMERNFQKKMVEPFIADFAKEMGVPVEDIRPFIDKKDWEGLVRYLIQHPPKG